MIRNKNNEISKVIFKTRGGTLDIKINKKWKYDDITCVGCDKNIETVDEILNCEGLRNKSEVLTKPAAFSWVFGSSIEKMTDVGQQFQKRMKRRQEIIEGIS